MTLEQRCISYGNKVIEFRIERRDRKTLEIGVEPDLGVLVAAPISAKIDDIDAKIKKRAAWILRQQAYFHQFFPRTTKRRYVAGETHRYLGRQYRLKIEPAIRDYVKFYRGFIHVCSTRPNNEQHAQQLVGAWYRDRARIKFLERLQICINRFSRPDDFRPKSLILRKLELRWGSMSSARRLLLNVRLVEAPVDAIDYVITHELCHIQEPHHGAEFYDLLERVMPDWQKRKLKLERIMS